MFLIEAIGPLLVICIYLNSMRVAAWIHFIGNTTAQHSLLKRVQLDNQWGPCGQPHLGAGFGFGLLALFRQAPHQVEPN